MKAPVHEDAGAQMNICEISEESETSVADGGVLMWIRGKLNSQFLDMLLDSGASRSCIARRCVTASPSLKKGPEMK